MIKKIFYKSDFKMILASDTGWDAPFKLKIYSSAEHRAFLAFFDGKEYKNCSLLEDGRLLIAVNNHNLGIGEVHIAPEFFLTDKDYADGICNEKVSPFVPKFVDEDGTEYTLALTTDGDSTIETIGTLPAFYMRGPEGKEGVRVEVENNTFVFEADENRLVGMAQSRSGYIRLKRGSEKVEITKCEVAGFGTIIGNVSAFVGNGEVRVAVSLASGYNLNDYGLGNPFTVVVTYMDGDAECTAAVGFNVVAAMQGNTGKFSPEQLKELKSAIDSKQAKLEMYEEKNGNAVISYNGGDAEWNVKALLKFGIAGLAIEHFVGGHPEFGDSMFVGPYNTSAVFKHGASITTYNGSKITINSKEIATTDQIPTDYATQTELEEVRNTASEAKSTAASTKLELSGVKLTANAAKTAAQTAKDAAATADAKAEAAKTAASDAASVAGRAEGLANNAISQANSANQTAMTASTKADSAATAAQNAGTAAAAADTKAEAAKTAAQNADQKVTDLSSKVGEIKEDAEEDRRQSDTLGDATARSLDLQKPLTYCGEPFILYGAGAPSANTIPANWNEEKMGRWVGMPSFIGQMYINTSASSNALWIAVNNTATSGWKQA